ncbi:hypothetical protein FQ330_08370 [Agrococcus sediminis]|uniref:Ferritin-like domain-containing protein n=1 Tax=Agrococcus sediminis TaxID=2599924 RepID=A0A5M8QDY9_9MICO|nr:hypothetical protein FQ330_08370 [Agrococcus sediminis]
MARQRERDRLRLDREGLEDAAVGEGLDHVGVDGEVLEGQERVPPVRLLRPAYPGACGRGRIAALDCSTVVKWFDRTPRDVTRQLLRHHRVPVVGDRVLLQDVRPALVPFVGQALGLELDLVAKAGRVLEQAPSLETQVALADVVRIHATRAGAFARILDGEGVEPEDAMRPFADATRDFSNLVEGADWYEQVLAIHVISGLLEDFFVAIVPGLPEDDQDAMLRALRGESAHGHLVRILQAAIHATPRLSDRLAVWGRRLVGDALLQMYLAVNGPDDSGRAVPSQPRLEPAFNDIVASHTRRMDELGLTA